jgi:hypothetical protein
MNVRSAALLMQVLLPAFVPLVRAAPAGQQPSSGLEALTVPERLLPPGCRLEPPVAVQAEATAAVQVATSSSIYPTNPWIGRERRMVANIARMVDRGSAQPDPPPLNPRQAAQFELRWADGITEAYRAAYLWRDVSVVEVVGVRFDDEKSARAVPSGAGPSGGGVTSRIVVGPKVARVSARGGSNGCFEAIRNHIESLR